MAQPNRMAELFSMKKLLRLTETECHEVAEQLGDGLNAEAVPFRIRTWRHQKSARCY